ncbi:hypothetical protein [Sphingorhabdus lacus]|uniref:Uncharacterized protein n=1 Tax=Sphingorhabdus lacus TaxID=392610 RepID=A0A6I6L263_9SPHN|nr:hypothetical protein [Sphingorhabdus lacus]QGY79299.1 hypothetical protein EUU25_00880 [Sphingorhabdus lacus]
MDKDEQNEELFSGINSHKTGSEDSFKDGALPTEMRSPNSEDRDVEGLDKSRIRDVEALKKKHPSERVSLMRERILFLESLGFDPEKTLNDFTVLRQMRPDPTYALLGSIPAERIRRMETWLDKRRPSVPKVVASGLLKSHDLPTVTIHSARFRAALNDSEKLTRMVMLCDEIIARLVAKRSEQLAHQEKIECTKEAKKPGESDTGPYDRAQIGRELIWNIDNLIAEYRSDRAMLLGRLSRARSEEERLFGAVPGWSLDIARTLESAGFDASSNRSVRRKVVQEIMEILERYAGPIPELRAKMDNPKGSFSLMNQVLEDRMTAEEIEAEDKIDEVAPVADDQPIPQDLGEVDNEIAGNPDPAQPSHLAPAFDNNGLSLLEISEPAQRADGHGRINGVENARAAYAGFASQFDEAITINVAGKSDPIFARLDKRVAFLEQRSHNLYEGDPMNWAKFEVPAGPYMLLQVEGKSSLLPRYTGGLFPSVANLEEADELLRTNGMPTAHTSPQDWGPTGKRPLLRPHVLDSTIGDPTKAYEVCRRLVNLDRWQWSDAHEPSALAEESIVRWWLFLLAGRMRPGQIDLLWPDGFFHGVEGHDPVLKDNGHYRLVRSDGGSISSAFKFDCLE